MAKRLLAIFGGGCHMADGAWRPTSDFELWPITKGTQRSLVRVPFDDMNPSSVIGMGELLLEAGVAWHHQIKPDAVAIAYGDSSPSLQVAGHPSENQVMSRLFQQRIPEANLEIFDPAEWNSAGSFSGTFHEAANLLRLVRRDGFDQLFVLAREAHIRAYAFLAIRLREPEFSDLREHVLVTSATVESVLAEFRPGEFDERIAAIWGSKSCIRSLRRESNAMMNFNKGQTQIIQKAPDSVPVLVGT